MSIFYTVIITEIPGIPADLAVQIAFKAINNLLGLNRLDWTLLVFGAYCWITEQDALLPSIAQYAVTIWKVIDELKKIIAPWQINNALKIQIELCIASVHDLLINLLVLIHQEGTAGQSRE